ncbi:hypothetical protein VHEMI07577 [[Torrubiella] hemipterigena]|uniref:Uncharacterized protein n=1 Tax=[Torrubiella] hemipterigena TaxID=1531966 RepID=A0A0A1TN66_9HYPO|nr:hypothetical protein VHEMI07577 [[Torrubiella] hemipterigena]
MTANLVEHVLSASTILSTNEPGTLTLVDGTSELLATHSYLQSESGLEEGDSFQASPSVASLTASVNTANSSPNNDSQAEDDSASDEVVDLSRQRGDVSLYGFYATTLGKWGVLLWLILVALGCFSNRLPLIYIRIWLQKDPKNNLY